MTEALNAVSDSERLARRIADVAFEMHPDDAAAAEKLINETVAGTSPWSDAVRGLARCFYHLRGRS